MALLDGINGSSASPPDSNRPELMNHFEIMPEARWLAGAPQPRFLVVVPK
jgi:hypothetical protein